MFVVYSLSVRFFGGRNPLQFFRDVRMAAITAFSTASSNATLPTSLKVAEEQLRLPPNVARFVLTAGASMNQNGTALFEGVTVLFIAQLYGVHISLQDQVLIMVLVDGDPRQSGATTILNEHYAAAVKAGATARDSLKSTFVLACSSPTAVSMGL